MSYNSELQSNNAELQEILDAINALPEPEEITLQDKTVTPTTSKQEVTSDSGFTGLKKVTVNAMPTATQATPTITVSSSGLITASSTQSDGYVASGTKSATKQLTTQGAKTVTPSTSSQTAVASGVYTTGAITVAAIPSAYITTDDATAVAENILSGKTAYVKGSKVTGTMPNIGYDGNVPTITYNSSANTLTPKVVVKKGYHHANTYTGTAISPSSLDANLKAENIKKDVSIFGVAGTYEGEGGNDWTAYNGTVYVNRHSSDISYEGTTCAQLTLYTDTPIILPNDATTENTYIYIDFAGLSLNNLVKAIKIPSTGLAGAAVSSLTFLVDDSSGYVTYGMGLGLGSSKTYSISDEWSYFEFSIFCNGRALSLRTDKDRNQYDAANNFIT